MARQYRIAPSLLSADFSKLSEQIKMVEDAGADWLHVDVMDGHFVPNLTFGPFIVGAIKKCASIPLDVHLMIENPDRYIEDFSRAGADIITVHAEACIHLHRTIELIKSTGKKAGVSINPHTPVYSLIDILQDVDLVLIMSVNPGFGGQKFIGNTYKKLNELNALLDEMNLGEIDVEVDGGVKLDNIESLARAGANVLVSGSGIYKEPNPTLAIQKMRQILGSV